jgi:protein TonB
MKLRKLFALGLAVGLFHVAAGPIPRAPDVRLPQEVPGRDQPEVAGSWQERLKLTDFHLRAGRFKKAKIVADAVLAEMSDRLASGPEGAPLLSLALLFRSLAEAGLGETEMAVWNWYAAKTLYPPLGESDLSAYGGAGAAILAEKTRLLGSQANPEAGSAAQERVKGPERLAAPPPRYPATLKAACIEGAVVLEAILDERGRPVIARLLDSTGGPVMSFAAIEAVRQWKFKPATLDGKPIRVYYVLTVNFELPRCARPTPKTESTSLPKDSGR